MTRKAVNPRTPALVGDTFLDVVSRAPAPPGRASKIDEGEIALDVSRAQRLRSLYKGIEEIADMWTAGGWAAGIDVTPEGRVLPNILHVHCHIPLVDVTGAPLEEDGDDIESRRRQWYAEQMRTANRMTPVHHIIGHSDTAWHDRITEREAIDRDEWRAMLWEPKHIDLLMQTYDGIYAIDWNRLPLERILSPLSSRLSRAERAGHAIKDQWEIKIQRARTELEILRRLVAAVVREKWSEADAMHSKLAEAGKAYDAKILPFRRFTGGLLDLGEVRDVDRT